MRETDLEVRSGANVCRAWFFLPDEASGPFPCIVMGHGFGLTRRCGLRGFGERFARAGFAVLLFDYRGFGDSGGEPRQVVSFRKQLEDWSAVIEQARTLPEVDSERIATWGFSLGAGHALTTAARDPGIAAVVAVAPMFDGLSSTLAAMRWWTFPNFLRIVARGILDLIAWLFGRHPVMVPLAAEPGEIGLLTSPDAYIGYQAMVPSDFEYGTAARIGLLFASYVPGRRLRRFSRPILLLPSSIDEINPPRPTHRRALSCPSATIVELDCPHMAITDAPHRDRIIVATIDFLDRHLRSGRLA